MGVLRSTRNAIRDVAKRYTPRAVVGTRLVRYFAGDRKDHGAGFEVARACHWRVASGPFEGLRYPWWLGGSVLLGPKLLGCFEEELHPVVERVVSGGYKTIVNVGCAEGYYVVGLAQRMPNARIIAYEADELMRHLSPKVARLNGVEDRIELKGFCSPAELREEPLENAFVFVDVEGYELTLLDPEAVPGLKKADFLVERHDGVDNSITDTLVKRFAPTHHANVMDISTAPRTLPKIEGVSPERVAMAAEEFRKNSRGWIEFRRK